MNIEEQINRFESCVEALAGAFASLDENLIMSKVTNWSPRDIITHLTGWNLHIVRGSRQILQGELPFYDIDPGPDYANINAAIISECTENDRSALLKDLADSANELATFLRTVDPDDWDRDFGVRYKDESLTIKGTMEDLIGDYHHHRVQLEQFGAKSH